jgi:flavodoxin
MKIGIIVHSKTGHTLSVAQKMRERLAANGHSAEIERVTAADEREFDARNVRLRTNPPIDKYDAIVLCAFVQGGRLSPAMTAYLNGIKSFSGKKAACLLTQFFPFSSWGGNQTIAQMTGIIRSKGAEVPGTAIVHWSSFRRGKQINDAINSIGALF